MAAGNKYDSRQVDEILVLVEGLKNLETEMDKEIEHYMSLEASVTQEWWLKATPRNLIPNENGLSGRYNDALREIKQYPDIGEIQRFYPALSEKWEKLAELKKHFRIT